MMFVQRFGPGSAQRLLLATGLIKNTTMALRCPLLGSRSFATRKQTAPRSKPVPQVQSLPTKRQEKLAREEEEEEEEEEDFEDEEMDEYDEEEDDGGADEGHQQQRASVDPSRTSTGRPRILPEKQVRVRETRQRMKQIKKEQPERFRVSDKPTVAIRLMDDFQISKRETKYLTGYKAPKEQSLSMQDKEIVFANMLERLTILSDRLGLPVLPSSSLLERSSKAFEELDFVLEIAPGRLELREYGLQFLSQGKPHASTVYCDFSRENTVLWGRLNHKNASTSPFHKAFGFKKPQKDSPQAEPMTVLDCTAGLGIDAFSVASLGFKVTMVESNPVIHALLEDGILRARAIKDDKKLQQTLSNLELVKKPQNSVDLIAEFIKQGKSFDLVFLDPMHATKLKSSLPKYRMQLARKLVGAGTAREFEALLHAAQRLAKNRVIFKRPSISNPINGLAPHLEPFHSYKGTTSRFDIYRPISFTEPPPPPPPPPPPVSTPSSSSVDPTPVAETLPQSEN